MHTQAQGRARTHTSVHSPLIWLKIYSHPINRLYFSVAVILLHTFTLTHTQTHIMSQSELMWLMQPLPVLQMAVQITSLSYVY